MELRQEAPPDARQGPSDQVDWRAVAEKLRAAPGEWFVVREDERDSVIRMAASRIALRQCAGFRDGGFEAVARRRNGITKAYARYVGSSA